MPLKKRIITYIRIIFRSKKLKTVADDTAYQRKTAKHRARESFFVRRVLHFFLVRGITNRQDYRKMLESIGAHRPAVTL